MTGRQLRPSPILTRRELLLGLAALWFLLVVLLYFVVNKPLEPGPIQAVAGLLRIGAGWSALVALANLIGRTQRRWLGGPATLDGLALQIGLGLGALSLLMLGLGAVGLYSTALLWLLVLLPLPLSLPLAVRDLRASLPGPIKLRREWLFVGLAGVCALLLALAPPTAWDSLVYQLTGPKLYLQHGGLTHSIDLPYLGFPKVGSMLFTLGLALAGPQLAQLLHLSFAALTLALLAKVVRSVAPRRAGLAAALLVGVPSLWLVASWAYVEWITAFWLLASFVLVREERPKSDQPRLDALAGLFAGFALGTKYTALWLVIGLVMLVYLKRRRIRSLLLFAAGASIALLPSLVADWALTGNPVYPFFFGGAFWDSLRASWFSRFGTGLSPLQLLLAGWDATLYGLEGGFFVGHPSYGATIGPLLLGLAPLALLRLAVDRNHRPGSMRDVLLMIVVGWVGWTAQLGGSQLLVQTRLLFPLFPFLAVAAAAGYDALGRLSAKPFRSEGGLGQPALGLGRRVQFVLGGLIATVLAITLLGYLVRALGGEAAQVALGERSSDSYLTDELGDHYRAIQQVNQLPAGSRVRFLWEPRSYYCVESVVCEPDALLDRWWHAMQQQPGAEAVLASWRREGVTHVLLYRLGAQAVRQAGFDPISPDDWLQLEHASDDLLLPVSSVGESYTLFELH